MKITVIDTGGTGLGTVTLGDSSVGDLITEVPLPDEERQLQNDPLALGSRAFVAGRGNAVTSFSWTVERQHATQTLAGTFTLSHGPSIPVNCSLLIIDDAGTSHSYSSAVISRVTCVSWTNVATVFKYSVTGAVPGSPL